MYEPILQHLTLANKKSSTHNNFSSNSSNDLASTNEPSSSSKLFVNENSTINKKSNSTYGKKKINSGINNLGTPGSNGGHNVLSGAQHLSSNSSGSRIRNHTRGGDMHSEERQSTNISTNRETAPKIFINKM